MALADVDAALDAYAANISYDLHGSATECAAFIEACRYLKAFRPTRNKTGRAGTEFEFDPEDVRTELAKAERWYAINGRSSEAGAVRHPDFSCFRD